MAANEASDTKVTADNPGSEVGTAWRPIGTAPRDGSPVWLCDKHGDADGPWPMRWNATASHPIFQRGLGMWVLEGGGMTWTEEHPDGAPELWAPRTSEVCPTPPWIVSH